MIPLKKLTIAESGQLIYIHFFNQMTMENKRNQKGKMQAQMKKRAIRAAIILAVVGLVLWIEGKSWFYVPWILCLYFLAGAAIHTAILLPVDYLVRGITLGLAWILSRVLLAFVFFFMIVPIGLWFRIMGQDRLGLKFPTDADSYWHRRSEEEQVPTCDKQY